MPVNSKHPDYLANEADWQQLADCLAGQRAVKAAGEKYLPIPGASDDPTDREERYLAYKKRAVFHNVTARTVGNMVGQCFAVDPVPTLPPEMEPWLDDIDGADVSANQQAKKALGEIVAFSRGGLWTDYPRTAAPVSRADAEDGGIRPRIVFYNCRQIINWRTYYTGAKACLSLVVIEEKYDFKDDGFITQQRGQYRVLRLIDGIYFIELHRVGDKGEAVVVERVRPLDGSGRPFTEIPFQFIGAEENSPSVEKPLMLDISNLNIAHYRNSADYEESVFMAGQPTAWASGLTQNWIDNVWNGKVLLGSRAILALPQGAQTGLLEGKANGLSKEAMDQKEAQMVALGAKLIEKREVAKTATESGINEASESSILASCCKNISSAYAQALRWAAQFADIAAKPEEILFELNTEFAISRMQPAEQTALLSLYQADLITFKEARDKLKSGGVAYLSDEDAKDELQQATEADFQQAQREMKAQAALAKKPPVIP